MRLFAEHKYGVRVTAMPTWREVFDKLGHSAVTIELLQIKPTNIVKINMNNPTDSNNKGWCLLMQFQPCWGEIFLAEIFQHILIDFRFQPNLIPVSQCCYPI